MATKKNFSKKEIVKEVVRCGQDPVYFISKYARIQHPVHGLVPFKTYPYQDDIIHAYNQHRRNIILKGRQLGMTTITAAYISWFILFHRDKNVLIVATKQETSKNMVRIVRNVFKHLPKWLKDFGRIRFDNRLGLELENDSRVKAITTSSDAGRSEAVSLLVVDEVAHIKNFDEIWTGLGPVVSAGGRVILMSTPNGTGNFFHRCYEQSQNNENGFNCKYGRYVNPFNKDEVYDDRFMWWVRPDYDESWFAAETSDKTPREVAQEYLCQFNASGDTFVYHEDLAKVEKRISEPARIFNANRNVWIWEEPKKGAFYLISADISRGDARDYSAFHVLRLDTHPIKQVAEYKGKLKPDNLGILLVQVASLYNDATIAPENNSGWSGPTILKIEEAKYANLYYSKRRKSKDKEYYAVDPYYASNRNDYVPGYSTTSANRLPMLARMEQAIRMDDIEINSRRTLEELKTFYSETEITEYSQGFSSGWIGALNKLLERMEDDEDDEPTN